MNLEFLPDALNGGPAIVLYGGGSEQVRQLRSALSRLSAPGLQVEIDGLPFVESVDGSRLRARSAEADVGVVAKGGPRDFDWTLDSESWLQVRDLLEPFCEPASGVAFQFLNHARGPGVIYSTERAW